jgi:hypothetical protein
MNRLFITIAMAGLVLTSGCNFIGFIASPSYNEQKIPAEFDLREHQDSGIMVIVEPSRSSYTESALRTELKTKIEYFLTKKARIKSKYIIAKPADPAASTQQSASFPLGPREIASRAGAALVLYVRIEDSGLYAIGKQGYYSGSLASRTLLIDVDSGDIVWPKQAQGRVVRAKVQIETQGRKAAQSRLTTATAHMVTRGLYDCPKPRYRISDVEIDYNIDILM